MRLTGSPKFLLNDWSHHPRGGRAWLESQGSSGYPASCGSGSLALVDAALDQRRVRGDALSARLSEFMVSSEWDPECTQNETGKTPRNARTDGVVIGPEQSLASGSTTDAYKISTASHCRTSLDASALSTMNAYVSKLPPIPIKYTNDVVNLSVEIYLFDRALTLPQRSLGPHVRHQLLQEPHPPQLRVPSHVRARPWLWSRSLGHRGSQAMEGMCPATGMHLTSHTSI